VMEVRRPPKAAAADFLRSELRLFAQFVAVCQL